MGRRAETEWKELPALVDQARDGAASKIQNGSCDGKINNKAIQIVPDMTTHMIWSPTLGTAEA